MQSISALYDPANASENLNFSDAKLYWSLKYQTAEAYMQERAEKGSRVLLEVAAQHPLDMGFFPGPEFAQRLDIARELYVHSAQLNAEWQRLHSGVRQDVQIDVGTDIYVPGSIHSYEGVADKISLSDAGRMYLRKCGVPDKYILGYNEDIQYKGDEGVYNSADECFVASQIFKNGDYKELICICSSNQVLRKTLFYIENGIIPKVYSVPSQSHHFLIETFISIPDVLFQDHSWQDPNTSKAYRFTREERTPQD